MGKRKPSELVLIALSAFLLGCEKAPPSVKAEDLAFQKPTATEAFTLRSKCAALGEKIMEENIVGRALTQEQTSHYNPKTNRCYVDLDVHTADPSRFNDYNARYLYDGQTREMLAWCKIEKGERAGFIFAGNVSGNGFSDAATKIDAEMADDRKQ